MFRPEFMLPVAFDAYTGIPLPVETFHRTEEIHTVKLDETFSDDLIPDDHYGDHPA